MKRVGREALFVDGIKMWYRGRLNSVCVDILVHGRKEIACCIVGYCVICVLVGYYSMANQSHLERATT